MNLSFFVLLVKS